MGDNRGFGFRVAVITATLCLLASACGARLTEEQRAAGIGALTRGGGDGGPGTQPGDGGSVTPGTAPTNGTAPVGSGGGGGPTVPGGGSTTAPSPPPGGNGGATDVGVTATKLTIATIADVKGVQPGLFRSAWQAMQALTAMVNAQGGVDGRQLDLMLLDSGTDTGATRQAVLRACDSAFALVGSMSAFDNGGAEAVDNCKIPDISAIAVTAARIFNRYTYPAYPNRPDLFIRGSGRLMRDEFPEASEHAAQLWLNTATTKSNAASKRKAYTSLGFDFIYTAETQVVESNYTPFVQKMRDRGVRFVTMLSDWQSIARLLDAMRKQRWKPDVLEWDSVVYTPKFLEETKGSADGSFFYLNTAMFEEIGKYPEMQTYVQWLNRVAPGVKPDYFGLYAWSAGRLFVEVAKKAGPKLTREGFMTALRAVHSWDGFGLHAAHDIGNKRPSTCTMFAKVQNGAFVRHAPTSGYYCGTPLYKVS